MKVISVSSDRKIFNKESVVFLRQSKYALCFDEFDIVVFTGTKDNFITTKIADNSKAIPTNSKSRLGYIFDAIRIGKKIGKCDVVTAQDPFEIGLAAYFIAKYYGAKLHIQIHTDFTSKAFKNRSFLNRIRLIIARFIIPKANHIRTVSEKVKKGIENKYRTKANMSVLPIYINIEEFKNIQKNSKLEEKFGNYRMKLLVVSRLESEKNVALAIKSFIKLRQQHDDVALIIIGAGSEESNLKLLAKKSNVKSDIYFEGFVDPKQYYTIADLVLVTSDYEGYGLVIVEALASGAPVLSTDVGIAREAGAIVVNTKSDYTQVLVSWVKNGQRNAVLKNYRYDCEQSYLQAYIQDIKQLVSRL